MCGVTTTFGRSFVANRPRGLGPRHVEHGLQVGPGAQHLDHLGLRDHRPRAVLMSEAYGFIDAT